MPYVLSIKKSALKAIEKIPKSDRTQILDAIDDLAINPSAGSALKGELSGLRRIRVGVYRIVYEVDDGRLVVLIVRVAHRREVYR